MDIQEATQLYEQWLGNQVDLVLPDLSHKHDLMAAGPFEFLRATYYRWAQIWPEACPELRDAQELLSIGDLHIENFGTWRDHEGRLVWGINDFDEAYPLPWTADLVRLATSSLLAIETDHLSVGRSKACSSILQGYKDSLTTQGRPFVLAEDHEWLRKLSLSKLRNPVIFWRKLDELPTWSEALPENADRGLRQLLPKPNLEHRVAHRTAGVGSLGRPRFVALANWEGGRIAREAKALVPSACSWAKLEAEPNRGYQQTLLEGAIRVSDPYLRVLDGWIVRRLAPDCVRVVLSSLPTHRDESRLLLSMGFELGNVHQANPEACIKVLEELSKLPENWLLDAAKSMVKLVSSDWKEWRKHYI